MDKCNWEKFNQQVAIGMEELETELFNKVRGKASLVSLIMVWVRIATAAVDYSASLRRQQDGQPCPWWNKELAELKQLARFAKRRWRFADTPGKSLMTPAKTLLAPCQHSMLHRRKKTKKSSANDDLPFAEYEILESVRSFSPKKAPGYDFMNTVICR